MTRPKWNAARQIQDRKALHHLVTLRDCRRVLLPVLLAVLETRTALARDNLAENNCDPHAVMLTVPMIKGLFNLLLVVHKTKPVIKHLI